MKIHKIIHLSYYLSRDCVCYFGKDNLYKDNFCGSYGELSKCYAHKYVYIHLGYNIKVTYGYVALHDKNYKRGNC